MTIIVLKLLVPIILTSHLASDGGIQLAGRSKAFPGIIDSCHHMASLVRLIHYRAIFVTCVVNDICVLFDNEINSLI